MISESVRDSRYLQPYRTISLPPNTDSNIYHSISNLLTVSSFFSVNQYITGAFILRWLCKAQAKLTWQRIDQAWRRGSCTSEMGTFTLWWRRHPWKELQLLRPRCINFSIIGRVMLTVQRWYCIHLACYVHRDYIRNVAPHLMWHGVSRQIRTSRVRHSMWHPKAAIPHPYTELVC